MGSIDTIGRKWLVVLVSSALLATAAPTHAGRVPTEGRWSRLRAQGSLVRDGIRLLKARPGVVKAVVLRPGGLSVGRQLLAAPEAGRMLIALAHDQPQLVDTPGAVRHLPLAIELSRAQPVLFRRLVGQLRTRASLASHVGEHGEAVLALALQEPALVQAGLDVFDHLSARHAQALARSPAARPLLALAKERPALTRRVLALAQAHPEVLDRAALFDASVEVVDRVARLAPRVAEAALSLLESRPALVGELSAHLDAAPPGLIARAAGLAERQGPLAEAALALLRERPALVDALLDEMKSNPRSGESFLALAEANPAGSLAMVRTLGSHPELLDLGLGAARRFPGLTRAATALAARPGIPGLAAVLSQVFGG